MQTNHSTDNFLAVAADYFGLPRPAQQLGCAGQSKRFALVPLCSGGAPQSASDEQRA